MALAKHPEHIHGRPLFLWHGTADDKVPCELNKEFYETIKRRTIRGKCGMA